MAALWPVFGLLVLTLEWVVLRRITPRLAGWSVLARAAVGTPAGFAISLSLVLVGLLIALVIPPLALAADALQIAQMVVATLFVTGVFFAVPAALFGAVLLAVERYRVAPLPDNHARD
jgi:hypothetical protein